MYKHYLKCELTKLVYTMADTKAQHFLNFYIKSNSLYKLPFLLQLFKYIAPYK